MNRLSKIVAGTGLLAAVLCFGSAVRAEEAPSPGHWSEEVTRLEATLRKGKAGQAGNEATRIRSELLRNGHKEGHPRVARIDALLAAFQTQSGREGIASRHLRPLFQLGARSTNDGLTMEALYIYLRASAGWYTTGRILDDLMKELEASPEKDPTALRMRYRMALKLATAMHLAEMGRHDQAEQAFDAAETMLARLEAEKHIPEGFLRRRLLALSRIQVLHARMHIARARNRRDAGRHMEKLREELRTFLRKDPLARRLDTVVWVSWVLGDGERPWSHRG